MNPIYMCVFGVIDKYDKMSRSKQGQTIGYLTAITHEKLKS